MDLVNGNNKKKRNSYAKDIALALAIFFLIVFVVILFTVDITVLQEVSEHPEYFYASNVVGISMYPNAYTGDMFIIETSDHPEFTVFVGDIIVYEYENQYIGHRVITVNNERYLVKGDNNNGYEIIPNSWIVGKVIKTISRYNPIEQFVFGRVIG